MSTPNFWVQRAEQLKAEVDRLNSALVGCSQELAKQMSEKEQLQALITPTTAVVEIGNSDDKLSQAEWAAFYLDTLRVVTDHAEEIHFSGTSYSAAPYQNACFVFDIEQISIRSLRFKLSELASGYKQDSIALMIGSTQFVYPLESSL